MLDIAIVGAGTAGCVLAARLTEDPATRVALLEAGQADRQREIRIPAAFSRLYATEVDWCYRTTPQEALDGREIFSPRGRMLGGSASLNAMMAIPGHRLDYERWPDGWSWAEVEQAYARSREPFSVETPRPRRLARAFLEAAREVGLAGCADLSGFEPDGVGVTPVNVRAGRRWSVADGYLRPALRRRNLEVLLGAHATRVLVEHGRATGVVYRQDGVERIVRAREVVLAAGAIDTPKLLLLSGIGPPGEIRTHGLPLVHALAGVGCGLRDHLASGVLVQTARGVETLTRADRPWRLLQWLLAKRGPLTSNVGEAAGFVRSDPTLAAPDLELVFAPVPFENEGLTRPSYDGFTVAAVLLDPASSGTVTLRSSDPEASPLIDPRYLTDPGGEDLRRLLAGVRLARRIAQAEPLARLSSHETLPGGDVADDDLASHVRAHAQTLYHPVGTCRMGVDGDAVVDASLRVRGLAALTVADASVLPALPRGHTNWPTVMVAERAADILGAAH